MKNPVPSPSFRPLYQQIKLLITQSLSAAEWRPGEAIPSEIELAARYQVSQGTVRKAINELAAENLLVRHQGKGTFVASHAEEHRRYHFTRVAPDRGERSLPVPELIDCRRVKADAAAARALDIATGAALVVIRRVLRSEGRPVEVDEARVPGALFRGLNAGLLQENGALLYETYEKGFGVRIVKAREQVRAVAGDPETARLLEVPLGTPLLQVDRVACTYGDRPVEVRRTFYNTADHHYRVDLV